jgi:uncharacterized protein YcaQ
VLAFVQASGPTHPAALAEQFGREREVNGWGGLSKATTRVLYRLQHHGLLRVLRRDSGVRVYEAVPTSERAHTDVERIEQITLLLARILAPVPSQTLAATLAPILRSLLGPRTRSSAIADLLHSGALLAEDTDGLRYLTPADLPMSGRTQKTVRFLAPFDPLVWDRRRF